MALTEAEITEQSEKLETERAQLEADRKALEDAGKGGSHREWKDNPETHKLTAEIARLNKADTDRADAKKKADDDAAIAKAEAEKDYAKAQQLKDDQHAAELKAERDKASSAEMKSELTSAGFTARGAKFLGSEYDAENDGTAEEYAKKCAEDAANAGFLAATATRKPTPPGKPVVGSPTDGTVLTGEQLKGLLNSDKPEERQQGRKYKADWWDSHGSFEGLPR